MSSDNSTRKKISHSCFFNQAPPRGKTTGYVEAPLYDNKYLRQDRRVYFVIN